jgi:uncharacterized membrane protein
MWTNPVESLKKAGWVPGLLILVLLALLPLAFGQILMTALLKLHLSPLDALLLGLGIILGSVINIPVKRFTRTSSGAIDPLAVFGLSGWWPRLLQVRQETVIAVNVGGCLIPVGLVVYQLVFFIQNNPKTLLGLAIAVLLNIVICHWLARPDPQIGIVLPGMVPPAVAALCAILFVPDQATTVAFVAGVLGPLVGADLFNLDHMTKMPAGMVSIGGAGTFDGIVLSGIVAAYLA